ncbi:hypothetical protein F5Y16DRAFT_242541 [Xylariaceae sp. FL0255]|nr:hypothetical protein F5Y16DRAFT_242541 [Xylariaceae sp. FL0255]
MSSSGLLLCPPWTATSPTNKTRSLMQIPNYHYGAVVASVAVPVLVVVQEGGVYPKPSLARITVVEYPQGLEANTMEVITLIRDQCKSTVEATAAHLTIFLGQDKFPVLQGQHKPTDRLMAHTAKVMLVLIPKGNLPLWFLPDILGVVLVVLASSLSSQCYDVLWADSALGNTTPSLIKEKSTSQDIITQESITRPEPKSEIQPAPSPSPILSLRGGGGGCLGFIEALFLGNGGYVDRDRQAFVRPSRHSHAGSSYRSSGSGHRRSHSHGGRSSRSHGGGSGGGHRSSRHGSNHHGRSHHRRSRRHGSPAHPPPLAQPPQAQSAPAGPVAVAETAAERLPR